MRSSDTSISDISAWGLGTSVTILHNCRLVFVRIYTVAPEMRKSSRVAAQSTKTSVSKRSSTKRVRESDGEVEKVAHSSSRATRNVQSSSRPVKRLKVENSDSELVFPSLESSLVPEISFVTEEEKCPVSKRKRRSGVQKNRRTANKGHRVTEESSSTATKQEDRKESKITKPAPLNADLTQGESKMLVGAHVSIAGGLYKAVQEAVEIGARSFGMFLRSQRKWESKPLEDKDATRFREACENTGYKADSILPHGIYLMNCGSPNEEILSKSRDVLVDELQRCETLGIALYNFHPGSTCGKITVEECLDRIAESINLAHSKTKFVTTLVENMSCQGHTVGGKFEELHGIIDRVHDKSRIGVCLDTCHAFAAGQDLSTEQGFNAMMKEFESVVGFQYLKAVHLNDSKGGLGCHLDRHENIGKGKIGLDGFRRVMQDSRFSGVPMILETPCSEGDTYLKEIKLLNSFVKKST